MLALRGPHVPLALRLPVTWGGRTIPVVIAYPRLTGGDRGPDTQAGRSRRDPAGPARRGPGLSARRGPAATGSGQGRHTHARPGLRLAPSVPVSLSTATVRPGWLIGQPED